MDTTWYMILLAYLTCSTDLIAEGSGNNRTNELNLRLENLRRKMKENNLTAYIVPNGDDHQSEEPAAADKHREYISGFTGTAGHALITINNATLWTDGRYYLQAEKELPSSWTVMNNMGSSIPDMKYWLQDHIKEGENVGIDPKKITMEEWKQLSGLHKINLIPLTNNLVDEIWEDRPGYSKEPLFIHGIQYCGEPYESKLRKLRETMKSLNYELLVVTALDEIAWLFNLRGNDLPHSPLFVSYALVTLNSSILFIQPDKISSTIKEHLRKPEAEVEIKSYFDFWDGLNSYYKSVKSVSVPSQCSYAVHTMFPKSLVHSYGSIITDLKAVKNNVEIQGSRNAHIRDSLALCELSKLMEEEIPKGIYWDELKVADVLHHLRIKYGNGLYKGPSFKTHAAFGPHAAMPHYKSNPDTNIVINTSAPFTLDSGGQYLDGTTDTTRVYHFGEPTGLQKEVYTSLLQGVVDLADTIIPTGIRSDKVDIIARRPLLKLGLTFTHGITHGTGIFSNVHESYNRTYFEHFIGSQEPGYYLKNEFGMRLENLVVVEKAAVQNENNPFPLLAFSPLTLVPYESKLMNLKSLDFRQISWINNYHSTVKEKVGNEMITQGKQKLYEWLLKKTTPLNNTIE